jgi:hypothetical protein
MYSVGMRFHEHLCFNTSPAFRWTKIVDVYCSHCGAKDTLYGLCDATNTLHNQVACNGCGYISNVPEFFAATPGFYGEQIEALRQHAALEATA